MISYSEQAPGAPESRGVTAAPLGLHQITAMEAAPADLIVLASRIGCQEVSVFTHIPQLSQGGEAEQRAPFPLVRPADIPDCLARLRETGLRVANIEFFSLTP